MSEVLDRPTTQPAPQIHPDILRLMARPGYYLLPGEPEDVRHAIKQLADEDLAWAAHMENRE